MKVNIYETKKILVQIPVTREKEIRDFIQLKRDEEQLKGLQEKLKPAGR